MLVADPEIEGGERTKLLDFGIAKHLGPVPGDPKAPPRPALPPAHQLQTRDGVLLGTPMYMSPEQCRGAPLDGKSDVYALAVLMYQMLAGAPPFVSPEGEMGVLAMHLLEPVPPLQGRAPGITPALAALVERMLAKAPAQRPAMSEVVTELAGLAEIVAPFTAASTNSSTLRAATGQLGRVRSVPRRSLLLAGGVLAFVVMGTAALLHRSAPVPHGVTPARPAAAANAEPTLPAKDAPTAGESALPGAVVAGAPVTPPPSDAKPTPTPRPTVSAPRPSAPAHKLRLSKPARPGGSSGGKALRTNQRRPSRLVD